MYNSEFHLDPEYSSYSINTQYQTKVNKKDINNSFLIINYFQDKYFPKNDTNYPKFNFDRCFKLKQLDDLDGTDEELSEIDKTEIIFGSSFDIRNKNEDMPDPKDDKRKKNALKMLRMRYRKHFKIKEKRKRRPKYKEVNH